MSENEKRFGLEQMEIGAAWLEKITAKLRSYYGNDLYRHDGEVEVPEKVYEALLDGLDKTREMLLAIAASRARQHINLFDELDGMIADLTEQKAHVDANYQAEIDRVVDALKAGKLQAMAPGAGIEIARELQATVQRAQALAMSMLKK
jgi:hypothetical protein